MSRILRACAALTLAAALGSAPAFADPNGVFGTAVQGANIAIKNAENAQAAKAQRLPNGTLAQVPPVTQQPVGGPAQVGLPTGFTYTLDASVAYPWGNIGKFNKWLPGGMDAVVGYGLSSNSRVVANYYELQHYPAGFNSGTTPLFLPSGFPPSPINPSCVNLSGSGTATCPGIPQQINVTTKDRFLLLMWEKLLNVGNFRGRQIPIVITPTYVSRWSGIAGSNGNGDQIPFVGLNGIPYFGQPARTAQIYSVAVTLPFLKTSKMFGTFTAAPSWLVHTAAVNQTNHMQIYQILYIEDALWKGGKIFFEPQSSRDYLPPDPYPEHNVAYFLGVSQQVGKMGFVQVVLNSGGPTNYAPYGVVQLNCLQLPCSQNTVPTPGGLKATQVQVQFGIGSPSVLQF